MLAELDVHLVDRRIHLVAAPGAGKTTLGLEVFRRLGQPALVLAPSRTIRDQWISRLRDFLPDGDTSAAWAGTNLEQETFLTAITYQALHTKLRRSEPIDEIEEDDTTATAPEAPAESELEVVIARCRKVGVATVILDEAHHLRQEWWRALSQFRKALGDPVLVCLTATPPYDVISAEWRRYEELCGPIDEEISIPELVHAGTLCPHQDFIHTCPPSEKDIVTARQHDEAVARFLTDIAADSILVDAIKVHPWISSAQTDAEQVLDDPEFAVAMMALLQRNGLAPPERLLRLLGCEARELPGMDRRWWSTLLKRYLFGDEWSAAFADHRTALARRMRQSGLLFRRELRLLRHSGLLSALSQSSAKIESCVAIHRLERATRGASLRQVILTDFIRDRELDRLGAWPVFVRLVRSLPASDAPGIALLTGRFAIVHQSNLRNLGVTGSSQAPTAEADLPDFLRCPGGGALVDALTRCLQEGQLHTLVGTRSLLGEGWDCPAVNSLVLASYVGAFVATNQMRGRAIRIDPRAPEKVASIWHLVAFDTSTPSGLADLAQLEEKFETFAGLHACRPAIEAGLPRLLGPSARHGPPPREWNAEFSRRLADLASLRSRWAKAIDCGTEHRVIAAVEAPTTPKLRRFVFSNTLRYLLYSSFWAFVGGTTAVLRNLRPEHFANRTKLYVMLGVAAVVGLAFSLPQLLKSAWISLRHLPADGSLRQIGWAMLDTLIATGTIKSPPPRLDVRTTELEPGRFSLALIGGTFFESSVFADCLEIVLGPIDNPRYVIRRSDSFFPLMKRHDYHAVPPTLCAKKEHAEAFLRNWHRRVGAAELVFTRSPEGRQALLHARVRALSTVFADKAHRRDRWC